MPLSNIQQPKTTGSKRLRRRDPRRRAHLKAQAAGIAAGLSLLASGHALAADIAPSSQPASLSELQAENTRLRQEVQRLQAEKGAPVPAAAEAVKKMCWSAMNVFSRSSSAARTWPGSVESRTVSGTP